MIKNIFKKFKRTFSSVLYKRNKVKNSKNNNATKSQDILNNKFKVIKFEGKSFDLSLLDNETKNIIELYEISNIKIKFFENLLKSIKIDKDLKLIKLKSKLKKETSIK